MPKFSNASMVKLNTCDERLQKICHEAIKIMDFTVIDGHRDMERQDRLFSAGKSGLKHPDSKHNQTPSLAVDIAPYPIDWEDIERFGRLAGLMFGIANGYGIELRWGGTWKKLNSELTSSPDMPHFEIIN